MKYCFTTSKAKSDAFSKKPPPCRLRREGDRRYPGKDALERTADGPAVNAVASCVVAIIDARDDEVRHVIPKPVAECELRTVCRRPAAGEHSDVLPIAFLVPQAQICLQRQGGGAGATSLIWRNHRHAPERRELLRHGDNARCFISIIIRQKYAFDCLLSVFRVCITIAHRHSAP